MLKERRQFIEFIFLIKPTCMKKVNIKYSNILLIAIAILFFAFLGYATYNFPMRTDDYTYRYVFSTNRQVVNFGDVIESQINHWFHWGGRFVAHTCVQLFLMCDKVIFSILNTICYAVCCFCIMRWGNMMAPGFETQHYKENKMWSYLLILLTLWLVMPSPHSFVFWLTGCCNYLWSLTFSALFLFCLFSKNERLQKLSLIVGPLAGNGHESVGMAISAALVLYACLSSRKKIWFYAGIVSYGIGLLSNIVAPGNYARMVSESSGDQLPAVYKYLKNFFKVGWRLTFNWSHPGVQCCTSIWMISLFICVRKIRKGKEAFILPLCFLIGAASSISLNVLTGISGPTSVFGFCFVSYIAFICVLGLTDFQSARIPVLLAPLLINAYMIPRACADIMVMKKNVERVEEGCSKNITIVRATPEWEGLKTSVFASTAVESCTLRNWSIERYLGVKDISLIKDEEYSIIEKCSDELMNLECHQVVRLDNCMEIVKLRNRPDSFHLQIEVNEKQLETMSVREKLMHRLNSFKKHQNEGNVICLNGIYYLYWMNKRKNDAVITIRYERQNQVVIKN